MRNYANLSIQTFQILDFMDEQITVRLLTLRQDDGQFSEVARRTSDQAGEAGRKTTDQPRGYISSEIDRQAKALSHLDYL
jgi:hypothetical protein